MSSVIDFYCAYLSYAVIGRLIFIYQLKIIVYACYNSSKCKLYEIYIFTLHSFSFNRESQSLSKYLLPRQNSWSIHSSFLEVSEGVMSLRETFCELGQVKGCVLKLCLRVEKPCSVWSRVSRWSNEKEGKCRKEKAEHRNRKTREDT